jgi:NAD(P)-dependent dehydrogenase (short-subunit alcohol dehydrogenase family)
LPRTDKDTDVRGRLTPASRQYTVARIPLGRMSQPEEQARDVRLLLSDDASFVSGVCLLVDGGLTSTI